MIFRAFPSAPLHATMLNTKSAILLFLFTSLVTWQLVFCTTHPADKSDFWDNLSWNYSNTPESDVTHDYWDPLEDGTTDATLAMNNYIVRMHDSEIIPQLIVDPPRNLCKVIYSYELGQIKINPGIFLWLHDVQNPPEVIWECDPNSYYAITLTDPDDLGLLCQEQLWLLGNIRDCNLTTADVLYNYRMPFVGDTLGVHRFNFFVYKQPHKIDYSGIKSYIDDDRCVISVKEFSDKYKLGKPIAGNFFLMDF